MKMGSWAHTSAPDKAHALISSDTQSAPRLLIWVVVPKKRALPHTLHQFYTPPPASRSRLRLKLKLNRGSLLYLLWG